MLVAPFFDTHPCIQLGISAPQGCGKTTLVFELEKLSTALGIRAASVSIDDFYLSHAAQQMVTAAHPDNPLLAGRGNAGTHDLQLGKVVLTNLRKLRYVLLPCIFQYAFSLKKDLSVQLHSNSLHAT
jgi:pantothenate kinase-related protein Tda10